MKKEQLQKLIKEEVNKALKEIRETPKAKQRVRNSLYKAFKAAQVGQDRDFRSLMYDNVKPRTITIAKLFSALKAWQNNDFDKMRTAINKAGLPFQETEKILDDIDYMYANWKD